MADYEEFAERHLNVQSKSGREWMCICVFHEDRNASMQFNIDKGMFVCFSCGVGGGIKKLEQRLGVSHQHIGVGVDTIYRKLNELRKQANREEGPRIYPESHLQTFSMPHPYWNNRGLTDVTIEAFDLGYDIGRDAVTIPVRTMNGELLGVVRRYLDPDADVRYRYPKRFHKREHLFASWMVAADQSIDTVALTEGAIDTITLWQWGVPAMAIYGSDVSELQLRALRRLGITKVQLFFDNDKPGQNIVRQCLGWHRTGNGVKWERRRDQDMRRYFGVSVVDWKGVPKALAKDINDLQVRGNMDLGLKLLETASVLR